MDNGPHSPVIPEYFRHVLNLLREVIEFEQIDVKDLRLCNVKQLYQEMISTLPPPKCVYKHVNLPWNSVWTKLENPVLDSATKDLMFLIVHNIIPNRQRLYRLNKAQNELCQNTKCLVLRDSSGPLPENLNSRSSMAIPVGGPIQDNEHLFCECENTKQLWAWVRSKLLLMMPDNFKSLSNFELLH